MQNVTQKSRKGKDVNIQGERWVAVTKSDSTVFEPSTIFVGTAGDIAIKNAEGDSVVLKNIANGTFLPVLATQVLATGTGAGDIVRFY